MWHAPKERFKIRCMKQRRRAFGWAALVLLAIWAVAWLGHTLARRSRVTAEQVHQYVHSVDFASLPEDQRRGALQKLADQLNALPFEERRQVRLRREWEQWFTQMTDAEKDQLIQATFPTGLKQMITAFERMPEDRRRRTIDESLRRLRQAHAEEQPAGPGASRSEPPPPISPELEGKIRMLGLKTFIAESSAQTKAEVAPLLEEIQRTLESGGRLPRPR